MKSNRNNEYQSINEKLNTYLEDSTNGINIDVEAKNAIWNNIINDMHQQKLKRNYIIKRRCKVAVATCLLIGTLMSIDLSSNASLFERLIHTVMNNTIEFHTNGSDLYQENRDAELDNKIISINEDNTKRFISPIIPDDYSVKKIYNNDSYSNIFIYMCSNDDRIVQVDQKYIANRDSNGLIKYNPDLLDVEVFNNNGIKYNIIKNNALTIVLFVIDDIEFEVQGNNKQDVLDIAMSLHY